MRAAASPQRAAGAAAAAALLGALLGCGPDAPPAPTWPPGTSIAVGGVPLDAGEVDKVAGWLAVLTPELAAPEHRRRALTFHLIPRLTTEANFPEAHRRAREAAQEGFEALSAGAADAPATERISGGWDQLGVAAWAATRQIPLGQWVGPVPSVGRFRVLRIVEHTPGAEADAGHFVAEVCDFPYVPATLDRDGLGALTWDTSLTIVDPEFERVVPLAWRANMQSAAPDSTAAGAN